MNGEQFGKAARSYIRDDIHWGCDLDVLKEGFNSALMSDGRIDYLDIGCGTGFHIAALREMYPEASIAGLDFSHEMLELVRDRHIEVELLLADIALRKPDITGCNVVSFLNNGLGNMTPSRDAASARRGKALTHARSALRSGGTFVVSVYNRKKLNEEYGPRLRILHDKSDIRAGDLELEYASPTGERARFYSHWFTRKELCALLRKNGFDIVLVEERLSRLVVKAVAV